MKRNIFIAIPCLLRGGTEMQTLLLVRALVELGNCVEVCCYFEYDPLVVDEFKRVGATVQLLRWSRSIGTIKFIRSLTTIFRKKSPSVVHVQYVAPGLMPIIAARLAKISVVFATVHYPGTPHGILAHGLLRFGAMLTNRFTCVSEAAEKSWFGDSCILDPALSNKMVVRKHITIPNTVDSVDIDKALAPRSPQIEEAATQLYGKMVVGTMSRLSKEKGIDILIQSFALVHKTVPQTHLLIVGEGNQRDYLQSLAQQLGIGAAITWLGRLPWKDAISCLDLMDVVVVPSRFEGFGLTAVEAMACKKPVVASRVDGLAEIIQDGVSGFLVKADESKAFADRISYLLKYEERRKILGIAARKHVEENYTYPIFRDRIKALYSMF